MPSPDPKVTFAVLLAGGDDGGEVLLLRSEGHVDRLAEGGLPADAAELLPDNDRVISSVRMVRIVRIVRMVRLARMVRIIRTGGHLMVL